MRMPELDAEGRRYLLFFVCAAACLAGVAYALWPRAEEPLVVEAQGAEVLRTRAEPAGRMTVYISGAVKKPGVYDVPAGSRVYELVRAAGDVVPYADVDAVNLSAELADGETVHVPLAPERTAAPSAEPAVNLNTAGMAELESLPGVGEVTARKILDYRGEHGLFRSKEELMQVPSIGEGRYEKIKDRVTL